MKLERIISLCLTLALPSACVSTQDDDDAAGSDLSAITNGTATNGYPSVGYLSNRSAACSATLIAPRAVLTAAHCVKNSGPGTVEFGTNTGGWKSYAYSTFYTHPSYAGGTVGDVAVVILNKVVPGVTPSALYRSAPTKGQQIALVGFGYTSMSGGNEAGNKYVGFNRISAVSGTSIQYDGGSNNCSGDSGGPSFISGRVVGVHSSGYGNDYCSTVGWDARVDTYATWILSKLPRS